MAAGNAVEGLDEIRESAAEATAGNLIGGDAVGLDEVRVHQVVALIVEDHGHVGSPPLDEFGGGEDQRGLARSEEATD